MEDVEKETPALLAEIIKKNRRIIFNGNSYSAEWEEEAERRGLPNIKNSVDAYRAYLFPESVEMFERLGVYTEQELLARYEIKLEKYIKVINIEAQAMLQMAKREILPAVIRYAADLADSVMKLKKASYPAASSEILLGEISENVEKLNQQIRSLEEITKEIAELPPESLQQEAEFCRDTICPAMEKLRETADALEAVTDKKVWPMPTYDLLLFGV